MVSVEGEESPVAVVLPVASAEPERKHVEAPGRIVRARVPVGDEDAPPVGSVVVVISGERPQDVARERVGRRRGCVGIERAHRPERRRARIRPPVLEERTEIPMRARAPADPRLLGLYVGCASLKGGNQDEHERQPAKKEPQHIDSRLTSSLARSSATAPARQGRTPRDPPCDP